MGNILEFLLDMILDIIVEVLVWFSDSKKLPKTVGRVLRVLFTLVLTGFAVFTLYQGVVSGKTGWFVLTFVLFAYMAITIFMYLRKKK